MSDLPTLVKNRLSHLRLSTRQAARLSNGLVSHATISNIMTGVHQGRLKDETIRGLALALDMPASKIAEAAGITMKAMGTEFRLPEKAATLNSQQRRVILRMVDALLAANDQLRRDLDVYDEPQEE